MKRKVEAVRAWGEVRDGRMFGLIGNGSPPRIPRGGGRPHIRGELCRVVVIREADYRRLVRAARPKRGKR
jgi:hypothetical protein